ncbi:TonB-dependent receptor [Gemmatimonas sp.]|uniref:TonB-dependent receptor n=1 Tax=Gemmatimonas sp. TaxID=1962908 RepID=UPI003342C752
MTGVVGLAVLTGRASAAVAQATGTLEGKVTVSGSGEALQGASVGVVGTQVGAITRADGTFRFSLRAGTYELRVRMLGYAGKTASITLSAGGRVTQNFVLDKSSTQLEAVAVTGSRGGARTVVSSPVPVDVINSSELRSTGRVETAQMLQAAAPSLNFPRPAVSDGTDHVRPATLRGLAPDQTLVLVNGKRRYTSALINNNGTVGRGTSAVDLNAIPASMIDRIEILRDGAAAQYGSDAIAGVINIILKGASAGGASVQAGQFNTDVEGLGKRNDGGNIAASADQGYSWGNGSFVHAGIEWRNRAMTNRAFNDPRQQFPVGDPREATARRDTHWSGDAATADVVGMINASQNISENLQLYGFGSFGRRDGRSTGFFRRPLQNTQVVARIHPSGFLPNIESNIDDFSFGVGAKGTAKGWDWDLSQVYGNNAFQFIVSNSNNASLGLNSPTVFDAGTLGFGQALTNFDVTREVRVGGKPVRLSSGAELRWESYSIKAGEEASYLNGRVPVLDANGTPIRNAAGNTTIALVGSQVFPGFSPADATDQSRTATAAYLDVESDLTKKWLVGAAARFENFSDFGSQATGKITTRFAPTEKFAIRGAASTGFRAPSLQQSFFTSTATTFVNGLPADIKTLPVASREARLLGARELKPENSVNLSAGITLQPSKNLTVTADYYDIAITDRIVLSENFIGTGIVNFFAQNGFTGIGGGRYFTNAINTKTNGLDVVANYGLDLKANGVMRFTAGYNQNKTRVTKVVVNTPAQLGNLNETLFGRAERGRIEVGQPRNNLVLSGSYERGKLGLNLRGQRFGEVTGRQPGRDHRPRQRGHELQRPGHLRRVPLFRPLAVRLQRPFPVRASGVLPVKPQFPRPCRLKPCRLPSRRELAASRLDDGRQTLQTAGAQEQRTSRAPRAVVVQMPNRSAPAATAAATPRFPNAVHRAQGT